MALLDVILGYDCNLACDYCTITPAMRERALSTRRVLAEMRRARARGYDRVSFTGGEPTIRRDLVGLVRRARELGYEDVKVQSNGLLFAHAPNVARIVDAGASTFHVSIHTHDAEAYDRLVRRPDSHRLMAQGLSNLVEAGLDPVADVILKSDTHARLPDAVRWLHDRGVRRADLWFVSLTDGNRDNLASMPRMSEVVPAMAEAFELGAERGMSLRSLHVPRCLLGPHAEHAFDPAAERVMVLTPDDVFELERSALTPQVHVPACEGCPERGRCRGVRPDYLERYGDAEIAAARGRVPRVPATRLPVVEG
ncbi:MAG TPA: radical SAM protein [Sandaracinaceae bacterium LLY-WYZ-13_1]|nr:radical SAM protein [Sandaracinaceae bacterium LLY-WYZ-13_1]